ncbi:MAG TPA: hypothetical protein DDZ74_12475 [Pseudomonas sp.]|nr:hypothetical protein [Pseudomonas sp.]
MYLRRICWRRLPEPAPSRVNPLLRRIGGGHRSVIGRRPSCRSGFTREEAGPAGQSPPAVHRCRREQARSGRHNQ